MTPPLKSPSASGSETFETGLEISFTAQTDNLLGHLSVVEQKQSWDGPDAIFCRQCLLLVNVDLADLNFAGVFLSEFIQHRPDHLARTAPFRPKIHENRRRGL